MPISRIRALVLGLLAVMLAGSIMAATASAEAGPFWHHRTGGEGEGSKIEPKAPENISAKGGVQTFTAELSGVKVEMTSPAVQVKSAIFNAAHQGQIKLDLFYQPFSVKVGGVAKPLCKVTLGQQGQFSNIIQLKGHLAWKWNGTLTQLEEQPQKAQKPDIVFTTVEPQEQPERPLLDLRRQGVFAEFKFVGTECGLFNGTSIKASGSKVGLPNPSQLEEWTKKLEVRTIASGQLPSEVLGKKVEGEGFLQHIWVGNGYQPLIVGLTFGENAANLTSQIVGEASQQEISIFEK